MKRALYFVAVLFISHVAIGQEVLRFDKRTVECEDMWVVMKVNKDSTYSYGFIYIDQGAGLTFNYEGRFKIMENGFYLKVNEELHPFKVRLEADNRKIAVIPSPKLADLKLTGYPEWLKSYKTDTSSVRYFYSQGFRYNGWGLCEKALAYLETAVKMDPQYPGLSVEIAYSYNCLGKYDKAVKYLQNALLLNPGDAYINKELIYAQTKQGDLEMASMSCRRALEKCADTQYNAENCYNLLYMYFLKKDKTNFAQWNSMTRKWLPKNSNLLKSIEVMEKELVGVNNQ